MRAHALTILFTLLNYVLIGQIVTIPDANFKDKLLEASTSNNIAKDINEENIVVDVNEDGEIQTSEALLVYHLDINNSGIEDLTGINSFLNLRSLRSSYNELVTMDFTSLVNLDFVLLIDNNISSLIGLENLTNLEILNVDNNNLTILDATSNTNLTTLLCGLNDLTSLNVVGLSNLEEFRTNSNNLTTLDLSGLTGLERFSAGNNQLDEIDLSESPLIETVWIPNNNLTHIDLSFATRLKSLYAKNNLLVSLNIKNGKDMEEDLSISFFFRLDDNPTLEYICVDTVEEDFVTQVITDLGYLNCAVNSYCTFVPGGDFFIIEGVARRDLDENGCDSNDPIAPMIEFEITDGDTTGSFISNDTGAYFIPVQEGTHTIVPSLEHPNYWNVNPSNLTVTFPTDPSPFEQDFCITANGEYPDLEIVIIPTTPARPGFEASYRIVYSNKGNQVQSGEVRLSFNDQLTDFVSAIPGYDNLDGNLVFWNYTNLSPFESRVIDVVFEVNSPQDDPPVNNGDELGYEALIFPISGDETPQDNEFELKQIVVGSLDPNYKHCLQGEFIPLEDVGDFVHYLVRFENIGTFPAENVVVKDVIDTDKFQMVSFRPLNSSHDFVTRINENMVEFIFEGINLPFQAGQNEGYVLFKIKTKENLELGDTFTNSAEIFFDFNFPIETNTTETMVGEILSIDDHDLRSFFQVSPNPAGNELFIQNKENLEIGSIEVYTLLGQRVLAITKVSSTLDISGLSAGNYFLKINSELGTNYLRFIKK